MIVPRNEIFVNPVRCQERPPRYAKKSLRKRIFMEKSNFHDFKDYLTGSRVKTLKKTLCSRAFPKTFGMSGRVLKKAPEMIQHVVLDKIAHGNEEHQEQEENKAHLMDHALYPFTDGPALQFFDENEKNSPPVESRYRQGIDDSEVQRKEGGKLQKIRGAHFVHLFGEVDDAHGSRDIQS